MSATGRTRSPTATDYKAQHELREKCVAWGLAAAQLSLRAAIDRVDCGGQQTIKVATEAAILRQLEGKQEPHGEMGVYANSFMLKAMSVQKQVGIVVVNTQAAVKGGKPLDRVQIYCPDKKFPLSKSWANEVGPRLLRQQDSRLDVDELSYCVILHNGAKAGDLCGHFDATTSV